MKKILFGILAIGAISFSATGYVKFNTSFNADKMLKYNANGELQTTKKDLATPDKKEIYSGIKLANIFGDNKELLMFTGGRLGSNFNNPIKELGYIGARYEGNVTDKFKMTVAGIGLLNVGTEDDKDDSIKAIKESLKFQTNTDNDDELKKLGVVISKKDNPILLSTILEGKFNSSFIKFSSIFNTYYFNENTNHFENQLSFGSTIGKLRIDGSIKNIIGDTKGKEGDKQWFKLGGKTSGSVTLKINELSPNLLLKSKPSFTLDKTIKITSREDLEKFLGTDYRFNNKEPYNNSANLDKLAYFMKYNIGVENDIEYKIGNTTYVLGLDYLTYFTDQGLKENEIAQVKRAADTLHMKYNTGEITYKPGVRLATKYSNEGTKLEFNLFNKNIIKKYLGEVKSVNNKTKVVTELNDISYNNFLGTDINFEQKINDNMNLKLLAKNRLNSYLKTNNDKNSNTRFTDVLYTGISFSYNKEEKQDKYSSKTDARSLTLIQFRQNEKEIKNMTHLFLKSKNSIEKQVLRNLKVNTSLDLFGYMKLEENKNANILSLNPKLAINYIIGPYTVDAEIKSNILKMGEVTVNGAEYVERFNLSLLNSLSTNVDYRLNKYISLGTGLDLEYNYNKFKDKDMNKFMNNLDKLDSKVDINKDTSYKDTELSKYETDLLKNVSLPTLTIDGNIRHQFIIKPNIHSKLSFFEDKLIITTKLLAELKNQSNLTNVSNQYTFKPNNIGVKFNLDLEYNW